MARSVSTGRQTSPANTAEELVVRRGEAQDRRRPRRRRSDGRAGADSPRPIGEALLAAGLIDRATLSWALERQAETGERLGQILLAGERVHRLDLQRALGEQWSLGFVDLLNTDIDQELVRRFDPEMLLAEGWVPVRREGKRTIVATCEPPTREQRRAIRAHLGPGSRVELRTTTPLDIERTIIFCFREHIVRRSTGELLARRPDLSAAAGCSPPSGGPCSCSGLRRSPASR